MRRRTLLAALGAAPLAGCGFRPVYGERRPGAAALGAVFVDIIPNRTGQLLRQALQVRLEGSSADVPKRYLLGVSYGEVAQGLGVQGDNSTTRVRNVGTADWFLRRVELPAAALASGHVRTLDGYNIIDEQFFYQDLSEDAAQRRLAEALADQIVLSLALYFDKHPA